MSVRSATILLAALLHGCAAPPGDSPRQAAPPATAATNPGGAKTPWQSLRPLPERLYAIGETGRGDFRSTVAAAAGEIRSYIASGADPAQLVAKNEAGLRPLHFAAYMGYADVVAALLQSKEVRQAIDDADPQGVSAWDYSNIALRQTMWLCNPAIKSDPFRMVPLIVTQPYYVRFGEQPYRQVRQLLAGAGAKQDMAAIREKWQSLCKSQDEKVRQKVAAAPDLLETLLAESQASLVEILRPRQ